MPKKKQLPPPRKPTKHQLARWEQEKKRQRIIFGLVILVIVAALAIIGVGSYLTQYQPLHETVITVNNTRFNMNYYIKMLKHFGQNQSPSYLYSIAEYVAEVIEQNELLRQGAAGLGITVSGTEVDKALAQRKPPLSKDYRDLVRSDLLRMKLLDEYFDKKVPAFADQRQVLVMFLESESLAWEVKSRLEAGKDFGELAKELSLDGTSKAKRGDLGWHPKDYLTQLLNSSVPADYAFEAEIGVLSPPLRDDDKTKELGYWLVKVWEKREDTNEVHLLGMLLSSEDQAKSVRARLEAGEDLAKLAGEFSQLDRAKENGGDLGWITPGLLSPVLDERIFKNGLKPLVTSMPIRDDKSRTRGGYWLVKALAQEDNRIIDEEDRKVLKGKALNDWFLELRRDPATQIERLLNGDKIGWAAQQVMGGRRR